jgi:outer membrane protein assembly factor BamD
MPRSSFSPSRRWRAALAVFSLLAGGLVLSGCSWLGLGDEDTPENNANKDAAQYRERPIEAIYSDAWTAINRGNWEVAAAQFNEVDRQHPYSVWARRAMLMSAFCSYQANKYTDAIATADNYISLHPGSHEVAYAFYLKAISLYEQIVDVGRDQSNTEGALVALQDVVQRFPDTEYARDATLKIDLTMDHLAGKEMAVGRYYLNSGDYIGAINRFRVVVQQYQTTTQIAEALERLTEAYYSLGLDNEAQTAAAVLGANYPGSGWYKDAYEILRGRNLKPQENKDSWISKAFHKML